MIRCLIAEAKYLSVCGGGGQLAGGRRTRRRRGSGSGAETTPPGEGRDGTAEKRRHTTLSEKPSRPRPACWLSGALSLALKKALREAVERTKS